MADKNFLIKNGLTVGSTERISSAGVITGTTSTQSVGNSSTALATTAYVRGEIDALIDSAPGTLNTLDELAAAINDDAAFNTTLTDAVALKSPLASPTFTGNVSFPDDTIDLAHMSANSVDSDQYVDGSIDLVHMSANSVDSDQYVDGSIDAVHLAPAQTNITSLGTLTALTVDDITIDGSTISDAGAFTLDVGGHLNFDTDTGYIYLKDSGTAFGLIKQVSSGLQIKSEASDADMIFVGNDGGSAVTALTLDMSDAGAATFNGTISSGKIMVGTGASAASSINAYTTTVSSNLYSALRVIENSGASSYWDIGATGGSSTALNFYHNANTTAKISFTHSGGATFTDDIDMPDSAKIKLGTSDDLQLYHDGSNSYIEDAGTGNLYIKANADNYINLISAAADANLGFTMRNSSGTQKGYLLFDSDDFIWTWGNTAERLRIAAAGQIGIGGANYGTDGQVLTSTGASSAPAWEDAGGGGASAINDLSDAKTFGTSSIMLGDATTGTISGANYNTGVGIDLFAALTSGDNNTAVGYQALAANTDASNNTAVGYHALLANTTATYNTAIGARTLSSNLTGARNVAVGYAALESNNNTNGGSYNVGVGFSALCVNQASWNVAMGYSALGLNQTGATSVAIGGNCLSANTTGGDNTALGYSALAANQTGTNNVAVGMAALSTQTTGGSYNTAIGRSALANYTGGHTTAVGRNALFSLVSASGCTAVGNEALTATTGNNNTALGKNAGAANVAGSENVFIGTFAGDAAGVSSGAHSLVLVGYNAGTSLTSAVSSVLVGRDAGAGLTTAGSNTFIGSGAGQDATSGSTSCCVFIGGSAGRGPIVGYHNIAIGMHAFGHTTKGTNAYGNTYMGHYAGHHTTSGDYNTTVGHSAGNDISTGGNNLLLGYFAGKSTSPVGEITTANNQICLGNNSITHLKAKVSLTVTSDERDKADITNFTGGLDWINAMRPVTYKWDERSSYIQEEEWDETGENLITPAGTSTDILAIVPDGTHKKDSLQIGLLAQEVLTIEQANGYGSNNDTSLLVDLTQDETTYGLTYEKIVPILISAMKEQQTIIDDLKSRIETLED